MAAIAAGQPPDATGIFRRTEADRLTSPDQLDSLMQVTTPKGWITLATITGLLIAAIVWSLFGTVSTSIKGQGVLLRAGGVSNVVALSGGRISQVQVNVGDVIRKGQVVAIMVPSPDSPSSKIASQYDGRVLEVMVAPGDVVDRNAAIVGVEPIDAPLEGVIYVSANDAKLVQPGMHAQIQPANVKVQEYGYIVGRVIYISPYPSTRRAMTRVLGNDNLVNQLTTQSQNTPFEVHVELEQDSRTPSGFRWSSRLGPNLNITSGTNATSQITVRDQRPISFVFRFKP